MDREGVWSPSFICAHVPATHAPWVGTRQVLYWAFGIEKRKERKAWPLLLRNLVGEETQTKDHDALSKEKLPGCEAVNPKGLVSSFASSPWVL